MTDPHSLTGKIRQPLNRAGTGLSVIQARSLPWARPRSTLIMTQP